MLYKNIKFIFKEDVNIESTEFCEFILSDYSLNFFGFKPQCKLNTNFMVKVTLGRGYTLNIDD